MRRATGLTVEWMTLIVPTGAINPFCPCRNAFFWQNILILDLNHLFMLHRNLLLPILVAVLGWAGPIPAPAQIPTSFFEGWVSYQLIDSKAKMSTSKMWDTLFIAGDRAARKSSSISTVHYQSGYHDFLKTVERTRFTVYERRGPAVYICPCRAIGQGTWPAICQRDHFHRFH